MVLTSEYQYIGRSNEVKDQNSYKGYYLLMYARTVESLSTGQHTVQVKQVLVSTSGNHFYGFSTSGNIVIEGATVVDWSYQNIPASKWNYDEELGTALTAGGVTYPKGVDLREGTSVIPVGYGVTKDITISTSWTFVSSSTAGYLPQRAVTASVSATVTLPMIASASQPSVSSSAVTLGQPVTIYTNAVAGAGLKHTLSYQVGSASGVIAQNVSDSYSWTPSIDLAYQITNATEGTATITCSTYAGNTHIGDRQVTVTLKVPDSLVPIVSASWTDASNATAVLETLVQNYSALNVTPSAVGSYGSTISSVTITLNGRAYSGGVLSNAGNNVLLVTAVDSRGRSNSKDYNIPVAAYAAPKLTLSASRCMGDGTADEQGTHAKITVTGYVTQVNNKNSSTLSIDWSTGSESIDAGVGDVYWQKIVEADVNATKSIHAVLQDKLDKATRDMVLSTGYATLDFLAGGKGIAFGKAATREGFECAMPAFFTGGVSGITAADVGAVPSTLPYLTNQSVLEWARSLKCSGWAGTEPSTLDMPPNPNTSNHAIATANVAVPNGWIELRLNYVLTGCVAVRVFNYSWGEWEWVNPPMVAGVEYRTTERYNGKPVYIKTVNMGKLLASGDKFVSNVIDYFSDIVDYNVMATNGSLTLKITPYFNKSNNTLVVECTTDRSAYTAIAVIKYTK